MRATDPRQGRERENARNERAFVDDITVEMGCLFWWVSAEHAKRELEWEAL